MRSCFYRLTTFLHKHPFFQDAVALVRLQADHVSRALVPAFYRYLQAQDPTLQASAGAEFANTLRGLVGLLARAERELRADHPGIAPTCLGLWVEGGELGWVDVMAGPCTLY